MQKKKLNQKKREKYTKDLEFKKWLKEFMKEHDDVLRELAKR